MHRVSTRTSKHIYNFVVRASCSRTILSEQDVSPAGTLRVACFPAGVRTTGRNRMFPHKLNEFLQAECIKLSIYKVEFYNINKIV